MTEEQPEEAEVVKPGDPVLLAPPPPGAVVEWKPSPLAMLSDKDFDLRLELARKERGRIAQIQRSVMTEDVDYGTIPGTQKPTLYKPGAEILNKLAGLVPEFTRERETGDGVDAPHVRYQVECRLVDAAGNIVANGAGSANSWERKYRWRTGAACPSCGETLRRSDKEWYCWYKTGGCSAKFPLDQISASQMEHPDPLDLDNTYLKMADKRAMLAATLIAHAASSIFTQDLEDHVEEGDEVTPASTKKSTREHASSEPAAAASEDGEFIAKAFQGAAHRLAAQRAEQLDGVSKEEVMDSCLILYGAVDTNGRPTATLIKRADWAPFRKTVAEWEPTA